MRTIYRLDAETLGNNTNVYFSTLKGAMESAIKLYSNIAKDSDRPPMLSASIYKYTDTAENGMFETYGDAVATITLTESNEIKQK